MLKVKVEGFPMVLDPSCRGISGTLKSGKGKGREPAFMWILRKEARGALGIDVGANIGYTTLSLCKHMDRVIAIEPDNRTRKYLKQNIKLNHFSDTTTVLDAAVSDTIGEQEIYLTAHPNLTSLATPGKHKHKTSSIHTITLDSLKVLPSFIKMDIEGFEVEALRGAMGCLQDTPACKLLIEVHPQYYDEQRDFSKVLKSLLEIGFKFKYIVSAGTARPQLFKEKGYKPIKVFQGKRWQKGVYQGIPDEDAIQFSAFPHSEYIPKHKKTTNKIVRAILLVKQMENG